MTVTPFDTLKFANSLKAAGVPEKQAEAHAEILADALSVNLKDLATKDDLLLTRSDLNAKIDLLRAEMYGQFTLLKWMVGALIPLVIGVLIRLLFFRIP